MHVQFTLILLVDTLRGIWGPELDPSAITCFVCSSAKDKDCGDPMDEDTEQTIPFFECNRLFGVFDDPPVKYVQFRPTFHGKRPTTKRTTTTAPSTTTTGIPEKGQSLSQNVTGLSEPDEITDEESDEIYDDSEQDEEYESRIRRHWSSRKSAHSNPAFANNHEIKNGFRLIFSAVSRLWRKKQQPRGYAEEGNESESDDYQFSPFQTQGRPTGLKEKPQHYCYKVVRNSDIVERGCTNLTTKTHACKEYLEVPNVTMCTFCGLNFCNGIKGAMTIGTIEMIMGIIIAFSLIVNKMKD